ncbi:MAG TPA: hypothetical protein VFI47_19990 [Acidimicrobiales bacterium]|nr:hypothetical protein [Acidimicrobiales bacterium]
MGTMRTGRLVAAVAVMAAGLLAAGCGADDDGAAVRDGGSATQGGSASGSASASGAASASASGSGVAGDAEECRIEGGVSEDAVAEVQGELREFAIDIEPTTVPAGPVAFEFTNAGALAHEVAIVRRDDPTTVATTDDGAAAEESLGDDLIGEIEPFGPDVSCSATFDLAPGTYVLLCNVVEEGGDHEAHFAEGMFTTLTVTG